MFPPQFRNLDDPKLELFDLDEAFSSEKSRLAQITNKCGEEDLEYYIRYRRTVNMVHGWWTTLRLLLNESSFHLQGMRRDSGCLF